MSKVSVIIPIYNVEKYVKKTINSVSEQTLKDIEIICIDDASTDSSLSIINQCAQNDKRIKVIAYEKNKSASQARKDGVLMAAGEYILFLDGDDYLESNACEDLYEIASSKKVDIVHFGTNIINEGNADKKRIANLEKLLKPYNGKLSREEVFPACFVDNKYGFSIWNKIYTAQLCKKAFENVKDGDFPKAQDLYAFYILCYYAESYYGVPNKKYYNYRFGAGITGKDRIELKQFERFCKSAWVADSILEFANSIEDNMVIDTAKKIRNGLLNDCVSNWYNYLSDEISKDGFDLLCKYWKNDELVSVICSKFYQNRKIVANKVCGAKSLVAKKEKEIKTIGIFYYRYAMGGVQRVISLLIPMYISMGYNVVFFTDESPHEGEYELPDEVIRVVLPSSLSISKDEYGIRAKEFKENLNKYNIDVMLYHAASSRMLLFDILLVKLMNIPMILTVHEVAFQNMLSMNIEMANRPSVFKLADEITVLSKIEEKYWRALGVNAFYVPNPINNNIIERRPSDIEKNTIVWVGRLDFMTKRCLDTVKIMKEVVKTIPYAKLLIVGDEVKKNGFKRLKNNIEKNGLENNIVLCGHSSEVGEYYKKASIHLLTSVSETFPMTITESKSYGIPLVMYELPFLEIVKSKKGFISVPQGDAKAAANAIIMLLQSNDLLEKMGNEAKESLVEFTSIDLKEVWKNIIDNAYETEDEKNESFREIDDDLRIMMKSMLAHYEEGVKRKAKDVTTLKNKFNKVKNSRDYKVGHAVMSIPRFFIKVINKMKKVIA